MVIGARATGRPAVELGDAAERGMGMALASPAYDRVSIMVIPFYHHGEWVTCPHPVPDDDSGDYEESMNRAGYARATGLHPGGDERAVTLTVWGDGMDAARPGQRAVPGSPKYLLDIDFPACTAETVAVGSTVDLMNLLAAWAPVVQAAYVCDKAAERWRAQWGDDGPRSGAVPAPDGVQ